jgi:hemerythrin
MRVLQWEESMSVGDARIDADHRALFELLDRLRVAAREDWPPEIRLEILSELVRSSEVHFAREEQIMSSFEYPERLAHRAEHSKLMAQVRELHGKVSKGNLSLSLSVFQFLYGWLARHIEVKDKPLGQAYRRQAERH